MVEKNNKKNLSRRKLLIINVYQEHGGIVLLGSHFVDFDPIFMNLFANEHKLVLISGAGI